MKKIAACLMVLCSAALLGPALLGQTVETIPFRAVLSPANEVPPIQGLEASGTATLWAHVVRDASGQVVSGSVDFDVHYQFPGEVTIVGLHIHSGAAGVNGPVTINSGISGMDPVQNATGRGTINRQGQAIATNTNAIDTLRGMLQNPANYYLNLHTVPNPGGAIRGQLQRAEMVVLMGLMSPRKEIPPILDLSASGVASVVALATRDTSGALTSGEVIFDVNYTGFPEDTAFTGLHIHTGRADVNGPVTIDSGISGMNPIPAAAGGSGNLHFEAEVNLARAGAADTLNGLFLHPENYYINLHTRVNPGGAIRSQMHRTDRMPFEITMLPSNEIPAITGLDASANARTTIYTLRRGDGSVAAGTAIFDVNHRFPDAVEFTGLHIHNGTATENGPVTVNTGITGSAAVASATGFGNIFRIVTVSSDAGLATLNSLVRNPENHYVNLHSRVNPGGAVRAQVAPANTALPTVVAVISSVSDPTLRTVAPGGLMTIFGRNLTKVPTNEFGQYSDMAPTALNGTDVTVGGRAAPILVLGREPNFNPSDYIVVQVPFEAGTGSQPVAVRNSNGAAQSTTVTVASVAPALYFDAVSGVAFKASNFSRVRPDNAAVAGETIVLLSTGLGQTSPSLNTGQFAPSMPLANVAAPISVTIGGRATNVTGSSAVPGFVGFYFTFVQVPTGLTPGNLPVVIRSGDAASNTVTLAVR